MIAVIYAVISRDFGAKYILSSPRPLLDHLEGLDYT